MQAQSKLGIRTQQQNGTEEGSRKQRSKTRDGLGSVGRVLGFRENGGGYRGLEYCVLKPLAGIALLITLLQIKFFKKQEVRGPRR